MDSSESTRTYRILVINPGSNSTKIAIYENDQLTMQYDIPHSPEAIASFPSAVYSQYEYRLERIKESLQERNIDLSKFDAIAGRGGFARIKDSGTYRVNDEMVYDLAHPTGEHVANLGGILAKTLGDPYGIPAYITDPTCIDEMEDIARITGFKGMERKLRWQPLSHKATAKRLAKDMGLEYEKANFIIGHLGGGITLGAHHHGRVIDVNNGLDGDGPFSVDRPGTLPIRDMIDYCFDGGRTKEECIKNFISRGGLYSYYGTYSAHDVEDLAFSGDKQAYLLLEAWAYQIAKEIGSLATVLMGHVDAIAITGGLARSQFISDMIRKRVEWIAPFTVYPGTLEMDALAEGALHDLDGTAPAKDYVRAW